MNVNHADATRTVYILANVEHASMDKSGEGTTTLAVLAMDGSKHYIEIDGLTPGVLLDAALTTQSQD